MPEITAEAMTEQTRRLVPILGAMEVTAVESRRGLAVAEIPPGPNVNHFQVAYAGSLFSVAEVLGGMLALTSFDLPGFVPIVTTSTISFLRPATGTIRATATLSDDEIERVEAQARTDGKAAFTLGAELTDESGAVVARTEGVYQVRRF